MTKTELVDLVKLVFSMYNQQLLKIDEKDIHRAWYAMLEDCTYEEAYEAFMDLAVAEVFMPKPGQLRRAIIDARTKVPPHPDGYSAWGIFMTIQRDANFGTQTNIPKPEALQKTLERLGDSAYSMHTNGDREVFLRVYGTVVDELQQQKYKILKKDGRGQAPQPFSSPLG